MNVPLIASLVGCTLSWCALAPIRPSPTQDLRLAPPAAAEPGVAASRLARLAKGVNLPHWYWLPEGGSANFADPKYFTKDDAAMLRKAGITHVRLPIDPSRLFTEAGG